MAQIYLLLFILVVIAVVIKIFSLRFQTGSSNQEKLPYKKRGYLLSVAEKNFYQVLSRVLENHNSLLFAKVRLEDLLWIPKGTENRFGLRNRIKSRHIDFVLCDKENVKPLLAIELDDSSHNSEKRMERDDNIDRILHAAGLPLLRIRVQSSYDPNIIENQIQNKLGEQSE